MRPSIFNDVIGPVMRGPSSSHCAAALRIGRIARDLMAGTVRELLVEFDRRGSLATTHESQGSDMGLFGGLLGWSADDERLPDSPAAWRETGAGTRIEIVDAGDPHPNTYRLSMSGVDRSGEDRSHRLIALSTGGGMVEVVRIDDVPLSLTGDRYETLLLVPSTDAEATAGAVRAAGVELDEMRLEHGEGRSIVRVSGTRFLDDQEISAAGIDPRRVTVRRLAPVLPVLTRPETTLPFTRAEDLLGSDEAARAPLWEHGIRYEAARGGISEDEVLERMREIVRILRRSIREGIAGTEYEDRILGAQAPDLARHIEAGRLLDGGMLNRMLLYVTALMEVKSAMGVIVAAPTAGACAALPGACLAATDARGEGDDEAARALLAAAVVGVFIATRATFAAEVGGCQAEGGSGSAMAAAALVSLAGGSTRQALAAASMAVQSTLGMVCDPVANRVEVPCLGKNTLAASNALACANLALADMDPVIPLDEAIETMDRVGRSIPCELRCTALGGLSVTRTSREIAARLEEARERRGRAASPQRP